VIRREVAERELLGQPVRGLQYMLRRLALKEEILPLLVPDGIFGEETLEAVMIFQREFHPPVTGVVDLETWNAIHDRWREAERVLGEARSVRVFPSGDRSAQPGATHEFLVLPQAMFQVLAEHLEGIVVHAADGHHGPESVANIRWLQRAAGLPETGTLDRRTWDVLSRLYEVFADLGTGAVPLFSGGWG